MHEDSDRDSDRPAADGGTENDRHPAPVVVTNAKRVPPMTVATAIAAVNAATAGAAVTPTTEANAGTPPYAATVETGLNAATPPVTAPTVQPAVSAPTENNTPTATTATMTMSAAPKENAKRNSQEHAPNAATTSIPTDVEAEDPHTIPELSQREKAGCRAPPQNCEVCATTVMPEWRAELEGKLSEILKRFDRAEDAIASVAGSIANIAQELRIVCRMRRKDVRDKPRGNTAHMEVPHMNVGTSNPSEWHPCTSQTNAGDMVEDVTTPNCTEKEATQQLHPPGTDANRPVLVVLDNSSDQGGENNEEVDANRRTPLSHAKRDHCQPRKRVVACAKRLEGVTATATSAETSADVTPEPPVCTRRYKDPPGYTNVRDFGASEEPCIRPPLLQPKTHGVSGHPTPSHRWDTVSVIVVCVFACPPDDGKGWPLCCADSTAPRNKMLGIAPGIQQLGRGRGEGRCEQQIPKSA